MRVLDHTSPSCESGTLHKYILMLVPHEPKLDPRIKWVTELCAQIGHTHIISFSNLNEEVPQEHNGMVRTEHVHTVNHTDENRLPKSYRKSTFTLWDWIRKSKLVSRLKELDEHSLQSSLISGDQEYTSTLSGKFTIRRLLLAVLEQIISLYRFILSWKYNNLLIRMLYHRAKAIAIAPKVVICHDLLALAAGVKVKKLYQVPLIYDSHEFWPEADLKAKIWGKKISIFIERKLIRQADAVITVTPQLAQQLESLYGISGVLSVPNAEPTPSGVTPSFNYPQSFPIKFLFQGQVAPGRGIDEFLNAWSRFDDDRAVLLVRAPENLYLASLRSKYMSAIRKGYILFVPPVTEDELIHVASFSDVGIIPYKGPSLNHIYACPNKLSQYMQAGLAILSNVDLEFVSKMIIENDCGCIYNSREPGDLFNAIRFLIENTERLQSMKRNAYNFARTEFNWSVQSTDYFREIKTLFEKY